MSVQLVIAALSITCLFGGHAGTHRQGLLNLATGVFSLVALGVSYLTLQPALLTAAHYLGLCEGWHATGSNTLDLSVRLIIFVCYIMQLLLALRYHTQHVLLPRYTSGGYIAAICFHGGAALSQSVTFRLFLLNIGVVAPLLGLIWDMALSQRQLVDNLASAQHNSLHWQGVAKLLQETNAATLSSMNSKNTFIISSFVLFQNFMLKSAQTTHYKVKFSHSGSGMEDRVWNTSLSKYPR